MKTKIESERLAKIAAWRAANREKVLEHKRRYYQRHKAQHALWKKANPDKVKASNARRAVSNRIRVKAWKKANPQRSRELHRRWDRKQSAGITDAYVRKLVARHDGYRLAKLLPESFIQTKRVYMQLKRALCRSLQT